MAEIPGRSVSNRKPIEKIDKIDALHKLTEQKLVHQELVAESLKAEIHNLYVQQAANRRLRSQVRQLVADLNAAIILQIEKLNKPKIKKQKPIVLTKVSNQDDLLLQIKQYDLERYYQSKTTHPVFYRLVLATYTGFYRGFKFVARKLFRVARRLKNG